MISWNYRVFREENGDYVIREVFYAEDGSIIGCTENPVEPFGRTLEELAGSISDFQAALSLPTLTVADVPEPAMPQKRAKSGQTISSAEIRAQLGLNSPSPLRKEAS
jgi:hypothetical protein